MLGNVTGELTLSPSGSSGKASATLTVPVPDPISIVKSFTNDPVFPGGTVTLQFTIMNSDRNFQATGITFTDDFSAVGSGLLPSGLPMSNVCGTGSMLTVFGSVITLSGGILPAAGSCTFSITLMVPDGATVGMSVNTTSSITVDINGTMQTGDPATDTLFVEPVPTLSKMFTNNPVSAGRDVILEFTITNTSLTSPATAIAFTDELTTFLPFPVSATLPAGPCGGAVALTVSQDKHTLSFTGGSVAAGASCSFSVTLTVPVGVAAGTFPNTTSTITATVDAATLTGQAATDNLMVVSAPSISKSFTDDPVAPGGTVTLEFTLTHDGNALTNATDIMFTDDLAAVVAGMTLASVVSNTCGGTVGGVGTPTLTFSGGTLTPSASCTITVTLQVPAGATPGNFINTTSNSTATVSLITATGNAGTDTLVVSGLTFSKEFTDDPVIPGGTVTLRFTLDNTSGATDATQITFNDSFGNIQGVLAGLTAVVPLPVSPCGAESVLLGTTFIVFRFGTVTAGTSCTFDVTLMVPVGTANDTYPSTTEINLATIGTTEVVLPPAADELIVTDKPLLLSKSFTDDPVITGGTVTLQFTITNLDTVNAASAIGFTDDLNAALTGLAATTLPPAGMCNGSGTLIGTTLLTFSGGSLAAGASCTFTVTLTVPAGTAPGTVTNTTGNVTGTGTINGLGITGDPASDDLTTNEVTFTKTFDGPSTATGTPTLTFTITNLDTTAGVTGLSFIDDLSAVITGLEATGLPLNNMCGTGSTITGTSSLSMTGGELPSGGMCTINVPLPVPATATVGTFPNTSSDLSAGGIKVSGPATASLTIEPAPTFAKVFAPDSSVVGQVSTLTFTINNNTASAVAASSLDFTDNLPAGVVVAAPPNASTTCTGGTITAIAGASIIS